MERTNTIRLVRPEDAEGEIAEIYEGILSGRTDALDEELALSKLWMSLGNDADILEVVWAHTDLMYNRNPLSFDLVSMISLVVATALECEGCRYFHESALDRAGVPPEKIEQVKDLQIGGDRFTAQEAEVLHFAERAARDPYAITDDEFERLRRIGFDEAELLAIIDCIAFHVYTAYVQAISGIVRPGMSREEWVNVPADDG